MLKWIVVVTVSTINTQSFDTSRRYSQLAECLSATKEMEESFRKESEQFVTFQTDKLKSISETLRARYPTDLEIYPGQWKEFLSGIRPIMAEDKPSLLRDVTDYVGEENLLKKARDFKRLDQIDFNCIPM